MSEEPLRYRRVVLKLSGEALGPPVVEGEAPRRGIDPERLTRIAGEVRDLHEAGAEVAVVVGAGNLIRGRSLTGAGLHPVTADTMGILATVINSLALRDAVESLGLAARVMTARAMPGVAELYDPRACLARLRGGEVVMLAGGTGNPCFTTDSGAALRARELDADVVLKATTVDGVYSEDPRSNPEATRFERLTFQEALRLNVGVMDRTAFALCEEGGKPIIVLDLDVPGNCVRAARGEPVGTIVEGEATCPPRTSA